MGKKAPESIKILSKFNETRIKSRRIKIFGLSLLCSIIATIKWYFVLPTDISFLTRWLIIVLFYLGFAWVSLFFWSSFFGFIQLLKNARVPGLKWVSSDSKLHSKTAILMPIYNENPTNVFANLLAMIDDLQKTGMAEFFDIFVLSDSTNPNCWIEEEKLWLDAKKHIKGDFNLYYRRRPINTARKSGNIEDFCTKWGHAYDFMIVLDADSIIEGQTILTMAQLMEANENAGIIQAVPIVVNRNTLFARIHQFACRVYGPIVAAGLAYWQVGDSNYWGHNAIIRLKAFIECCGLPVLPGKAPFGGHILSHDFVEAALIRRGGWNAWLLPELKGSFEESPPTMIDYASRDRRWCQGNLQHIKVLISKDLHPISRIHFTLGIMSYLSSPIWLCFLITGLWMVISREFFPPSYFSETKTLFPIWPVFDFKGTVTLFSISMFMLISPKFLGFITMLIKVKKWSDFGGFFALLKSLFVEIFYSALTSPIMMMFQSKFVFDILIGRDSGWNTQNRGDEGTSFKEAFNKHIWHTLLGFFTILIVLMYAPELFWWTVPVTLGLILSIPISIISSKEKIGIKAREHKYFIFPEEINPPYVINKSKEFEQILSKKQTNKQGVELVISDSFINALHIYLLSSNGPSPDFSKSVITQANIKIDNYINYKMPLTELSREEEFCILYDADLLFKSNIAYHLKDVS